MFEEYCTQCEYQELCELMESFPDPCPFREDGLFDELMESISDELEELMASVDEECK